MAEAISLAKELNDMHALAVVLWFAAALGHLERLPAEVERCASDLIELSTRQSFVLWLAGGEVLRGWARSASGNTSEGLSWIEDGIENWRATESMWVVAYFLAIKAEALHLVNRTFEALEAIREAEAMVQKCEERWWCSELHRLRAVFLTAISADETQIEASLREAIRTANLESFGIFALKLPEFGIGSPFRSGAGKLSIVVVDLKNTLNRTASHSYPLSNRSDIVIEHQTLRGLRATVNLSQMDAAPLSLPMFLVFGSSGRERRKLGVHAKAR